MRSVQIKERSDYIFLCYRIARIHSYIVQRPPIVTAKHSHFDFYIESIGIEATKQQKTTRTLDHRPKEA